MRGGEAVSPASTGPFYPAEYYTRQVREHLPPEVFKPVPGRLWWLVLHSGVIAALTYLIVQSNALWLEVICGIGIGHSLGCLGFLGHEILHGTVVRGRRWCLLFGGLCMAQYGLLPQVWMAWHNHDHHNHTQQPLEDPDCFGPVALYRQSRALRIIERFTPGSRVWVSYLFLFFYFSLHSARIVLNYPFKTRRQRVAAKAFLVGVLVLWPTLTGLATPHGWLTLAVIPLGISNLVMMSYVATNHFLNPLTPDVNDPLVNTLTVHSNRLVEQIHLHHNFHVEHHLFPYVSPKYGPLIAKVLKERWGERYKEMSHLKALWQVYDTPRHYACDTLLMNPRTGESAPTLPPVAVATLQPTGSESQW